MTNKILIIWCLFCVAAIVSFGGISSFRGGGKPEQRMWQEIQNDSVLAWSRHKTGFNQDDKFLSVATIPGSGGEDEVWVIVERTINGVKQVNVEQFQPRDFGDQNDAWFVDCGLGGGLINIIEPTDDVTVGEYPTLQVADGTFAVAQADPGLTQTTAISNVAELQAMQDDLTGNYYLANDIDATGFDFVPIGQGHATHTEFTGTFDGCGYTISNLTVDKYYADGVRGAGLFGAVRQGARIANLTLENVSITSDTNSGSVLGQAEINPATDDIIIQNCHASGSVTDTEGNLGTGGFVGGCWGGTTKSIYFYDCTTSCEVKMAGDFACQAGGFVGWMGNDIICQNCRATGNVEVTGDPSSSTAGGFVACDTDDTNYCIDCAATGNVTNGPDTGGFVAYPVSANFIRCSARGNVDNSLVTNQEAGGFSGWGSGVFTDCYSWGNVSVSMDGSIAGGFAPSTSGTYLNCYSIGTVDGGTTGGFVEDGTAPDSMVACFWDTESSDEASGVGYGSQPAGLVGHITSWMKTKINYERAGWDFADVWEMETLPILGVESVCVIPGSSEDEIWLTVTREINDSQVRYIERMKPRNWGTDQADCFFVDSGLTYDGDATTTFTGLDHLEGETVAILGDGAVFPTQMVTNGSVTLSESVSVCHIGLPFTYKLKPMRMDQGYNGTSKGSIKKISEAVISFYKTLNARYGDGTDTYDIDWRETDAEYTTPPDLVTGDKVVVADGGFSVEDPFQIEGSDPLPCTVRAIIPRIEVTGR